MRSFEDMLFTNNYNVFKTIDDLRYVNVVDCVYPGVNVYCVKHAGKLALVDSNFNICSITSYRYLYDSVFGALFAKPVLSSLEDSEFVALSVLTNNDILVTSKTTLILTNAGKLQDIEICDGRINAEIAEIYPDDKLTELATTLNVALPERIIHTIYPFDEMFADLDDDLKQVCMQLYTKQDFETQNVEEYLQRLCNVLRHYASLQYVKIAGIQIRSEAQPEIICLPVKHAEQVDYSCTQVFETTQNAKKLLSLLTTITQFDIPVWHAALAINTNTDLASCFNNIAYAIHATRLHTEDEKTKQLKSSAEQTE